MIQRIEGVNTPGAPHCNHCGPHLVAEHPSIGLRHQAGAVHQRLDLRRYIGNISRRAQQDAVGLLHLFDIRVAHVAALRAAAILSLRAFAARQAAVNLRPAHLDKFRFNAFVFQFLQNVFEQNCRIAALAGTAIEGHNLYMSFSHVSVSHVRHPVDELSGSCWIGDLF